MRKLAPRFDPRMIAEAIDLRDYFLRDMMADVVMTRTASGLLITILKNGDLYLHPKKAGFLLGVGGFKRVYAAYRIKSDYQVEVWADLTVRKDLLGAMSEDDLARKLKSPYVVGGSVLWGGYTGRKGGEPASAKLSMIQPLASEDLASYISRHPLPVDDLLLLLRRMAKGVKALHDEDIVHRDIKPENFLVIDRTVRLADLGLAKKGSEVETGHLVGTLGYLPPEAFVRKGNKRSINPNYRQEKGADVYALGLVYKEIIQRAVKATYKGHSNSYLKILSTLANEMTGPAAKRPDIDTVVSRVEAITLKYRNNQPKQP